MTAPTATGGVPPREAQTRITEALHNAAHLLPAQGPITIFVHHNTLHALEDLPFEEAVVKGGAMLGCEPWLSEERYRSALREGRITEEDLASVIQTDHGERAEVELECGVRRAELILALLRHGIPDARGPELDWLVTETDIHHRLRGDLGEAERGSILGGGEEQAVVTSLWEAALGAAGQAARVPYSPPVPDIRLRDLLLRHTGQDTDGLVHPLLIRLCAAFIDQGVAYWPMPSREKGFYRAVVELYGSLSAPPPEPWSKAFVKLLAADGAAGLDAQGSLEASIEALGMPDLEAGLLASALALRGWAGMFQQLEHRPDRVPVRHVEARFVDFMAVRLLLDRAATAWVAGEALDHRGEPAALWRMLPPGTTPRRNRRERAWRLFHAAQLLGWGPAKLRSLPTEVIEELERELIHYGELELRRLFHLAYERHLHRHVLDSLAAATPAPAIGTPRWQGLFCVDEREESLRRHVEELAPDVETLGIAGFFGVAMYYRGLDDAHPRPLCPIVIRPRHEVHEVPADPSGAVVALRGHTRRAVGRSRRLLEVGSHTFVRGTLISTLVGALTAVPLLFRILAPGWSAKVSGSATRVLNAPIGTRIAVERREGVPTLGGAAAGFTVEEMADIVGGLLHDLSLAGRLSPLVMVVGHRSASLNNPLESAYDCGACGGGRGGPNARAFAAMANLPAVRALLAERGSPIPEATWFVGAEHNTASDAVVVFDRELVPEARRGDLERALHDLDEARARNAHERCRRFEAVPTWLPPTLALAHVEARANDLAQARPEYCHATNAMAIVGRRSRTRGLFLDRRAFLVSYDPTSDADGAILARLLGAIVPVTAGINLEYYFGSVDPVGYGCDTKLPHNIAGLVGVMDGHASDLRTGLPIQTLELHEPVRQLMVVEAPAERVRRVVLESAGLRRVFDNRWVILAALDPDGTGLQRWRQGEFHPYEPGPLTLPFAATSDGAYHGRRGNIAVTRIGESKEVGR